MPSNYKARARGKRPYLAYTEETKQLCYEAVSNKTLSIREASKKFKIPRATISYMMSNKHLGNVGCPTTFTKREEELFVIRIIQMCEWGFPLDKLDLRMFVADYLRQQKRTIPKFANNTPGDDWATGFMKRWELSHRLATNIRRKRAKIEKEELERYFANLEKTLEGVPKENIWNYDETNLRDDPGSKKVVMKRGTKYPERVMNSSKQCYSLMFCGNAAGEVLPPYVVFKSVHLYRTWVMYGPKDARYNRTKSGWFDEVTFEDWFFSTFLPRAHKQEGKKVLIGDNLSSHLSEKVIAACKEHNISFVCLVANATHLLQPLDVAFFAPLKKTWRMILTAWKKTPRGRRNNVLPKEDFSRLLAELMAKVLNETACQNLISGFGKCGISPFDPSVVYTKLPSQNTISPRKAMDESLIGLLSEMRYGEEESASRKATNNAKNRLEVEPGKSVAVPESDTESDTESEVSTSESEPEEEEMLVEAEENHAEEAFYNPVNPESIMVGLFALVRYKYPRSEKYYVGEIAAKTGDVVTFYFLQRMSDLKFKNRDHHIPEETSVSSIVCMLPSPLYGRRNQICFESSRKYFGGINMACLY